MDVAIYMTCGTGTETEVSRHSYLREALKIPAMKSPGKPGIAEAMSIT
jgi:hypothetical protein